MDDDLSEALIYMLLWHCTHHQRGHGGLALALVLCRCQDNFSNPLNSDEDTAYDDR